MTDAHLPILFLSGAGLQPWIWDEVRRLVPAESVVAPRPAGHSDAPLSAYVDAAVLAAPPGKFAVVAHSSGGVVGSEVVRLVPERAVWLLAISAVIPADRQSFVSAMPAPNRWVLAFGLRVGGTGPPAAALRRGLAGGLAVDAADRLVDEFEPESRRLYLDRTQEHRMTGRRGFLFTTEDRQIPLNLQRRFAQRLGGEWSKEIATGHVPMLQDPHTTASSIEEFLSS